MSISNSLGWVRVLYSVSISDKDAQWNCNQMVNNDRILSVHLKGLHSNTILEFQLILEVMMKRCFQLLIGSFILVLISGCGSGESVIPSMTPSPTSTITPTPILFTSTPSLPGKITGRVVNSAGEPLAGVGIKLLKKRNLVTETKTGADGNFTFENVPAGKYTIGYDYFPEGGFTIHYFSDEFEVQSEMTSQQDYVIKVQ